MFQRSSPCLEIEIEKECKERSACPDAPMASLMYRMMNRLDALLAGQDSLAVGLADVGHMRDHLDDIDVRLSDVGQIRNRLEHINKQLSDVRQMRDRVEDYCLSTN